MKKYFVYFALFFLTTIAWSANAANKNYAYAASGDNLYIIDADSDQNIGIVKPLNYQAWAPSVITISPDNRFAYVINDGSHHFPAFANIAIVDTHGNQQIGESTELSKNITLTSIQIAPNGKYGYIGEFSKSRQGAIEIFDTNTNRVIGSVKNFDTTSWIPKKIAFTPDAKKAIVVLESKQNSNFANIIIIDTATHSVIKKVGDSKHEYNDLVISPNGQIAYFSSSFNKKEVMLFDLQKDQIIAYVGIHDDIYHYPFSIAITPNGNKLYIIDTAPFVSIFNTQSNTYAGGVEIPHPEFRYYDIQISPEGRKGYITGINGISVFDVNSDKELVKINISATAIAFFKL